MPGRWGCFQRAGPSIARPCCAKSSRRPTELVSLLPSPSRAGRAVRGGESRGAGLGAQPFQAGCPDSARPAPSPPAPPPPRPAARSFPEEASRTLGLVRRRRLRPRKGMRVCKQHCCQSSSVCKFQEPRGGSFGKGRAFASSLLAPHLHLD